MDVLSEVLKLVKLPGGHILQRRIFLPKEFLLTALTHGCTLCSARCRTRNHLPLADARPRLCPAGGWGTHCSRGW
jgi:hypothetical protein